MSDNTVNVTIDGQPIAVPKGTLVIRAAEQLGIHIPRFCDHPLLDPVGACRQCLVEVAMPARDGVVRPMPKPQTACTMTCSPQMEVKTAATSEVAKKAQHGITEFLLINHPLDCPICDKGGECPLQNQSMSHGTLHTRFTDVKRTWPKPVALTSQILLDRDRCILCQRCTRFATQIAGDPFISLQGRGGGTHCQDDHFFMGENIGTFDKDVLDFTSDSKPTLNYALSADVKTEPALSDSFGKPAPRARQGIATALVEEEDQTGNLFASYFSGNIIQICPVGALTSKQYRFRARPFDLISTRGITEQDASGAAIRTDIRRGVVTRRLAQRDMAVNEEWITDKDRFAYKWQFTGARLDQPLVRENGELVPTSWTDALGRAAEGLAKAAPEKTGLLPGGRLTFEDAYAWSKFARKVIGTNNIDQRTRMQSTEEAEFLGAYIAGTGLPVSYADLEKAGQVLLVGFEPEDECGAIFLRLRKGVRNGSVKVATVAPFKSASSIKTNATVLPAAPSTEPDVIEAIWKSDGRDDDFGQVFQGLRENEGAVIVVGERAGSIPGLLTNVAKLAAYTEAKLTWVPRRSGERGGVEAGLLPELLPFARSAADAEARQDLSIVWETNIPAAAGKGVDEIIAAGAHNELDALIIGGVDLRDFSDPAAARQALGSDAFVVALEVNRTEAAELADVVFPVAPVSEKSGTFINWEGRLRPFGQALVSHHLPDRDVLHRLANYLGCDLDLGSLKAVHAEANELISWDGKRLDFHPVAAGEKLTPALNEVALICHKPMLDDGLLQLGAVDLAASARRPVLRMSQQTADENGLRAGQLVKLSTGQGAIELPLAITEMPNYVVWVPECSRGSHVHETLGVCSGALVALEASMEVAQ